MFIQNSTHQDTIYMGDGRYICPVAFCPVAFCPGLEQPSDRTRNRMQSNECGESGPVNGKNTPKTNLI